MGVSSIVKQKKTLKEIVAEQYKLCGSNSHYFMKKYCQIQHPTKGKIPFLLYSFQDVCLDEFIKNGKNIILKSRQLGLSTLIAGYALWNMTFKPDYQVLVIATGKDVAKNIITKVRIMYQNLPTWLKVPNTEDNKMSLVLENGSRIVAISSVPERARSEALSLLILDEAAFIDRIDEIWTASQQTIATGGDCIILSCVTKDTYVFTDRGIKQIKEFIPNNSIIGDYNIDSYNVLGNKKLRSGNLFHVNGKVKTYKIKTKLSEMEGSYNHKLWACKNGKYDWYELKGLSVGDWVNVQYGMNIWGNNDDVSNFKPTINGHHKNIFQPIKITSDIAYLIGLYLSEGSSQKRYRKDKSIYYSGLDITCGDDISFIFKRLNLNYYTKDNLHYNISSSTLISFFEYLGFDLSKKAHEKEIPSRVLEMGRENICALLSGIFDGDGYSRSDRGTIGIGLSSEKLIKQIRILLLNLGIRSLYQIYMKKQMNSYDYFEYPFKYDSYRLEFNYINSLLFYDKVGFRLNRKQVNKFLLDNISNRQTPFDVIPYSLNIMNNLFDYFDKGTWTLNKKYGLNINGILNKKNKYKSEHINSKNVIKMYEIVKDKLPHDVVSEYDKIIIPNSEWVQIKKIEESENDTYDFSLENTDDFWCHSIIYNGILGHNTPNGIGNWYHTMWLNALEGANGFNFIKLHWSLHPERDQTWRDNQDKELGVRKAAQECDCDFLTSGNTVVDMGIIQYYKTTCAQEPSEKRSIDKGLWIWEYPDYNRFYLISADVARGDGTDYSAAHVFDIENMRQVAEYKGQIGTRDYGRLLAALGIEYNNALIVVERENVGWDTIQELIDINYQNLFYSSNDLQYIDVHRQMTNKIYRQEKKLKPGFATTSRNRGLIINKVEHYFEDVSIDSGEISITIRSIRLLNELETFIWKDGKAQAQSGRNDDLVMALGIFLWVRDTALKLRQEGIDLTKMILGKISKAPQFEGVYRPQDVTRGEQWKLDIGKETIKLTDYL